MPLRLLALETLGQNGSLALAQDEQIVLELALAPQKRSAQSLAPGIRDALAQAGWSARELDVVAVITGPGSFTGTRVGVVTAKTLAYALAAKCIGVGSLETIAAQAPESIDDLHVGIDAQRGQVYAARYLRDTAGAWQVVEPVAIVDRSRWLANCHSGSAVSGPALESSGTLVAPGVTVVPRDCWRPRAATVARLAWQRAARGEFDDVLRLVPNYVRRSAAEEQLDLRRSG
ncbi:MAG: tRNA (adenosine(37)-N6)-threonylcarbamoyltransferase complex dimerization subunit type 1 TsaB [Pirellulales bacterium]|nr:tRNA (adenosine(37)-N6)-threonylcarbamoyltransferase complex dimerization subunit type 1 TsaB [Pirellulales bacterium]